MQGKLVLEREFESLRELSQRTGKTYRTLHRAVRAGKIKTVRFGCSVMVPKREVERILARGF
ncbi:MAG: helix-turn-helix domain-containing protein [Acidobacteriia bacterium]|nr:helix-turn-helix domain-containing protein [Terriglobia bacterium]